MTLRVVLVDDEPPASAELRGLLGAHRDVEVVGEASDVASAISVLDRTQPDALFLDIELGRDSGFGLLPHLSRACRVVFVTAFDQYAVRAFEVNALDYLLKPVHPDRLADTIARVLGARTGPEARPPRLPADGVVFLSCGAASTFVPVSSIACILGDGDYTRVVTTDRRERLVPRSLTAWEHWLPSEIFMRVHRSAIVNLGAVSRVAPIRGGRIRLYMPALAEPIVVSRRCAQLLRVRQGYRSHQSGVHAGAARGP